MIHIPPPPPELAAYIAARSDGDPVALYLEQGAFFSAVLVSLLPGGLDLHGERVLDFGCGSGRFLRHMVNAGTGAIFEGCDIHAPSIDWLKPHLPGPHTVFRNDPQAALPRPDGHYRLIYATSVFTHLAESWAAWLCELHRLLADDGVLVATVLGAGAGVLFEEDPWDDARVGMLVLGPGNPWEAGGPVVLHSEWWLRAHWGRAFEIIGFDPGAGGGQGSVVLRKLNTAMSADRLREIEPDEPRELVALTHALRRAHAECILLNTGQDDFARAYQEEVAWSEAARAESEDLRRALREARAELLEAGGPRQAARALLRAAGRWAR